MVGGSGGRHSPSQVVLGGRLHPLPQPTAKRWHALHMSAAEALAAAPETSMQVWHQPSHDHTMTRALAICLILVPQASAPIP